MTTAIDQYDLDVRADEQVRYNAAYEDGRTGVVRTGWQSAAAKEGYEDGKAGRPRWDFLKGERELNSEEAKEAQPDFVEGMENLCDVLHPGMGCTPVK